MTDTDTMTKPELVAAVERGWDDFHAYLATLTMEQVTIPTDPAGWTAKDHIAHLAIWEDSINALFEGVRRWEHMGIDRDLWESADWDKVNAIIQQRYKDITMPELREMWFGIHERLVEKLKAMSEEELRRPYREYQPDSTLDLPSSHWVVIDTFQHYDEHRDYIAIIVAGNEDVVLSKKRLLDAIEEGWDRLNAYLETLTEAQLTEPTDAAGWTAKDHVIHLAIWEDGISALLEKRDRIAAMGIDQEIWESHDYDRINAVIQQRYRDQSWAEVQQKRGQVHDRLISIIETLSDEDLQRPYRDYQPTSTAEKPVIGWISGNTYHHYDEHMPWIKAIVTSKG